MLNFKNTLSATILVAASIGTANATSIPLDSFNYDPIVNLSVNSTGSSATWMDTQAPLVNVDSPNSGSMIPSLLLLQDNGNPNSNSTSSSFINGASGELSFNVDSGVQAELGLFYTDLTPNATAKDFTFGNSVDSFYFDVGAIDIGFSLDLYVISGLYDPSLFISTPTGAPSNTDHYNFDTVYLDGLQSSKGTFSSPVNINYGDPEQRLFLAYDSFIGTADFTQVTGIFAILSAGSSQTVNLTLNEIGVVPEPTTLAIFGLGLIGLAFGSRRKV